MALVNYPDLFDQSAYHSVTPFSAQLLKWIGNKQRFAHEIIRAFPPRFGRYYEPFLGSGAVIGTLAPTNGYGSDVFKPLIEIWQTLHRRPEKLLDWYRERFELIETLGKDGAYEKVRGSYNRTPNGADLLFLSRTCYGGVVRFRKTDGYMSTPCGVHSPIPPRSFKLRVEEWHRRTRGVEFRHLDYREAMREAEAGDLVYCDPPYSNSQTILYGAQAFLLSELFDEIERCKVRGVFVALSIDGSKKSGNHHIKIAPPAGLFVNEIFVNCGRSMLRRFQLGGHTLEGEVVADRLLTTY